jgi:hypothetical protein
MRRLLGVFVVMVFAVSLAVASIAAEKEATGKKPAFEKTNVKTVTATVEAIDQASRMVTLKGPKGNTVTFKASDRVKNLPQVKVGDKVVAKYYESVAVQVKKPGEAEAGATETEEVATAKPGEKPAGVAISQKTITATVEAIDTKKPSVTLKGPEGNLVTVKVKNPKHLENVKVGDQVVITYTEALAISVHKAKKK